MVETASNIDNSNPGVPASPPRRLAFYGGTFDPVHNGHISIAHALIAQFELDQFVFLPAFHAPHKKRKKPTSAFDRYAMLCLITQNDPNISVSRLEIELPERPYSVETLPRLKSLYPNDELFFVMGADSWMDITTWREWETVLSLTNHIVVTRPGYPVTTDHVTDEVRTRIVKAETRPVGSVFSHIDQRATNNEQRTIFISDSVNLNISATEIRQKIRENNSSWRNDVPDEVANYIEKYQIYN